MKGTNRIRGDTNPRSVTFFEQGPNVATVVVGDRPVPDGGQRHPDLQGRSDNTKRKHVDKKRVQEYQVCCLQVSFQHCWGLGEERPCVLTRPSDCPPAGSKCKRPKCLCDGYSNNCLGLTVQGEGIVLSPLSTTQPSLGTATMLCDSEFSETCAVQLNQPTAYADSPTGAKSFATGACYSEGLTAKLTQSAGMSSFLLLTR